MTSSDDALDRYMKKLMELQYNRQESLYTDEELKKIALDAGLSESDWQQAQARAEAQKQKGKNHIVHANWQDAVKELEAACSLKPNDAEAHVLAAEAYLNQGGLQQEEGARQEDFRQAEYHLEQALQIDSGYKEAFKLKKELNTRRQFSATQTKKNTSNRKLIRWMVLGGIALVVIIWYFSSYNSMVGAEEQTIEAWAQVENVYQRRADLIPNLVATVQAAADFEQEVLTEVTQARTQALGSTVNPTNLNPTELRQFEQNQAALGSSLSRLMAVAEDYPQITATENFRDLQSQLEGTENRISVERRRFNQTVQTYNAKARKFPYNLLGFDTKAYFSANSGAEDAPDVTFD
ncbi:LemA family protein [Catalinimonas niigatensis]|uniref:LemA family protein n=1 Tax=Catalinimonas niigatensis TaxID=1397264 RepID=UPI002664EE6F|nr:LemA family protein [Catalinimonas niigatensis]WPP52777.1 LemA family protein [Catalinimonas niigatensis]